MLSSSSRTSVLVASLAVVLSTPLSPLYAEGFSPFNMMNPGRWFNKNSNSSDDVPYDDQGAYPPPPPPGYAPATGYAPAPGYPPPGGFQGYPPAYGQMPPATPPGNTVQGSNAQDQRIRELEARIEQLEAEKRAQQPAQYPGMQPMPPVQAPSSQNWQATQYAPQGTNVPQPLPIQPTSQHAWRPLETPAN